eukprot:scaffold51768_cov14-Tisochrysis_lutea.AAC.1
MALPRMMGRRVCAGGVRLKSPTGDGGRGGQWHRCSRAQCCLLEEIPLCLHALKHRAPQCTQGSGGCYLLEEALNCLHALMCLAPHYTLEREGCCGTAWGCLSHKFPPLMRLCLFVCCSSVWERARGQGGRNEGGACGSGLAGRDCLAVRATR